MKTVIGKGLKKLLKSQLRLATGLQKFQKFDEIIQTEQRKDNKYLVSLDVDFWQERSITFVYFVYLNPMFVASVWFGGYQAVVIDLISVYVLSMMREMELA